MDSENTQSLAPKGYIPPKAWTEITDSEKIERMREVIKGLQQAVGRSQTDIHKTRNSFRNHSHLDNKIVVPYDEYADGGLVGESAKSSVQNYF